MDRGLLSALRDGFLRRLALQHRNAGAGLQLVLSVDHDLLVGLEPESIRAWPALICATLTAGCRPWRWIDDIHVGALGPCCTADAATVRPLCLVSTSRRALTSWPGQSCRDLLEKIRLELDRSRCLQDLVVDEAEHALIQQGRIVLAVGENRKGSLVLLLLLLDLR